MRAALTIAAILCGGLFAQADETVAPIEYRRLYVEVGQEKNWPRNGFTYAPVLRLSDFEKSVEAIRATRGGPGDVARIQTAELVGRVSENMIEGEADFTLSLAKEDFDKDQQFVSFQGTNLEFSPIELLAPDSIANLSAVSRPGVSNGEVGIWAADATPKCRWRAVASDSGKFSLRLPPAASSTLRLQIGADQQIEAEIGIVREKRWDFDNELGEWIILPDAMGRIQFRVVERQNSNTSSPLHVAQRSDYQVGASSIAVSTRFHCVTTDQTLRKFELSSDARLILTSVHLIDQQQRRRPVAWEQSPPNEAGQRRLTVRLPESETQSFDFEYSGVVPLEYAAANLKAPLLTVDPAAWQESKLTISLNDDWKLTTLGVREGKQVNFQPSIDGGPATANFMLYAANGSIEFSLSRIRPRLRYLVGNRVGLRPAKIVVEATAVIAAEEGESLDLEFGLANPGWRIDSLTAEPNTLPVDRWYVDDHGKLIVRLKQPVTPSASATLHAK
ncbi:MAG: hypothetical protein ACIALR_13340, partial [Blastopirellula sp. JB062]